MVRSIYFNRDLFVSYYEGSRETKLGKTNYEITIFENGLFVKNCRTTSHKFYSIISAYRQVKQDETTGLFFSTLVNQLTKQETGENDICYYNERKSELVVLTMESAEEAKQFMTTLKNVYDSYVEKNPQFKKIVELNESRKN